MWPRPPGGRLTNGVTRLSDQPTADVNSDPTANYSFWEHLEEARNALLRSLLYVGVGTVGAWFLRSWVFWLLEWPAWQGARWAGVTDFRFRIFEPVAGMMLMLYAAVVIGLVVAAPLWLWEARRFIVPGLTPRERRLTGWFIPGMVGLFVAGVLFCYFLAPVFCWFLLRFNAMSFQVAPEWTLGSYLRFLLQCLVLSGLLFELPIVLMFLVWAGLTSAAALRTKWRGAAIAILIVAIVTPTTDPITMVVMSAPLLGLYVLSIALAVRVERHRRNEEGEGVVGDDPYGLLGDGGGLAEVGEEPPRS
jgi:sec-independent protein translocase protein TatC